ncbi:nucleotide pyrophosphohydrolase [Billgrantia azerbaijanica]|nr:nucleotide pyrophosphohydrolase [Halomonas azerbaijanica]
MSMTLRDICELQEDFDKSVSIDGKPFYSKINDDNMQDLEHLIVCLLGELGEFSNIVKKVVRGDSLARNVKDDLDEELVDVFIYLIKIANQFDVDLEAKYLEKLEKNKMRFGKKTC